MKISELGEDKIIALISEKFKTGGSTGLLGIGDDGAVIPVSEKKSQVITTDALIEDVHFIKNKISPYDLGFKSLAVNLSDIAAMGAKAQHVFLTLALPPKTDTEWLEEFFNGFQALLSASNVTLLGGDTVRTPDRMMISVTAIGEIENNKIKYRSHAKAGDVICVTRAIGDSAAGLECILKNCAPDADTQKLIERHYRPQPQLGEGEFLASSTAVTAMMDLSDGLNSDIKKLMAASKVGAEIHLEKLPLSIELQTKAKKYGWNAVEMAAIGGEDYCLLACVEADAFSLLQEQYRLALKHPLYPIGKIAEAHNGLVFKTNNTAVKLTRKSFEHF